MNITFDSAEFEPITWEQIIAIEPRLVALLADARGMTLPTDHPAYWRRYETLKRRLQRFVGRDAEHLELQSSDAWDVAHSTILAAYEGGQ